MARFDLPALTTWITAAALRHPHDLAEHVAERTGTSRATAQKALKRLAGLNWLVREGSPSRPHWQPGLLRQAVHTYALAGLEEDLPWSRDFAPVFDLAPPVRRMVQHAFTELLNNAIDHSGGTRSTVSIRQTPTHVQLMVSDDGCGVFDKIQRSFDIGDVTHAMLELSKGKLTSQPERHMGRGLFYTARLADVFDLQANNAGFQRRAWDEGGWAPTRALPRTGTSVYLSIALDTKRSLQSVLDGWSADGATCAFDRTTVPLRLLVNEDSALESRAQARRVVARLGRFRSADIDFRGVDHIGISFADELFRVLPGQMPSLSWQPSNMAAGVARVVAQVMPPA